MERFDVIDLKNDDQVKVDENKDEKDNKNEENYKKWHKSCTMLL